MVGIGGQGIGMCSVLTKDVWDVCSFYTNSAIVWCEAVCQPRRTQNDSAWKEGAYSHAKSSGE
jgi:hypothetical protein